MLGGVGEEIVAAVAQVELFDELDELGGAFGAVEHFGHHGFDLGGFVGVEIFQAREGFDNDGLVAVCAVERGQDGLVLGVALDEVEGAEVRARASRGAWIDRG